MADIFTGGEFPIDPIHVRPRSGFVRRVFALDSETYENGSTEWGCGGWGDQPNRIWVNTNTIYHVRFEKFGEKEGRYLGFIDVKKEEVSKFFNEWISSKDQEDNITDTKHLLYDILKKIEPPKDEEGNPIQTELFLQEVREFINGSPNRTVELKQLVINFIKMKM